MQNVVVLIGVPGSGKSFYAQNLQEELAESKTQAVILSSDELRELFTGSANDSSEDVVVWQFFFRKLEYLLSDPSVESIILDTTAARTHYRKGICNFVRRKNSAARIIGIYLNVPVEIALERNNSRSRVVPPSVIYRMYQNLGSNPPSLEEGFDELVLEKD